MDFYFVTLDGRTFQSCHYCDVETSVNCLDVSHSEFILNSIITDEAIFMEMILKNIKATHLKFSTNVHKKLLYGNIHWLTNAFSSILYFKLVINVKIASMVA